MRLSAAEVRDITSTLSEFLGGRHARLFLYGSRVRDDLKGGHIDLLVVLSSDEEAAELRRCRHRLLSALKSRLGERRIDLSIASEHERRRQPFWREALRDAVELR